MTNLRMPNRVPQTQREKGLTLMNIEWGNLQFAEEELNIEALYLVRRDLNILTRNLGKGRNLRHH
jgi:hypothetical protein